MSSVAIMSRLTKSWAKRESARADIDHETALSIIANKIKTGPGKLGNIVRQRVKTACADLRDRWKRAAMAASPKKSKGFAMNSGFLSCWMRIRLRTTPLRWKLRLKRLIRSLLG